MSTRGLSPCTSLIATVVHQGLQTRFDTSAPPSLDLKTRQSIAEILVRYYLDHTEKPDMLKLDDMSMLYRLVPGLAAADRSLDVYDQVIRRTTSQYDARRASDYLLRVLQTHDNHISAVMGIALFMVFLNKGSDAPFRRAIWEADMISAVINAAWNWIRQSATDAWEGNLLRQICLHSATYVFPHSSIRATLTSIKG